MLLSVEIGVVTLYVEMKYSFQLIRSSVLKLEPCCDRHYPPLFAACYWPLTPWAHSLLQNSSGFNQTSFTLLGKEYSSFKLTPLYVQREAPPREFSVRFRDLSFMAHLFLTPTSFAVRSFLKKRSLFSQERFWKLSCSCHGCVLSGA